MNNKLRATEWARGQNTFINRLQLVQRVLKKHAPYIWCIGKRHMGVWFAQSPGIWSLGFRFGPRLIWFISLLHLLDFYYTTHSSPLKCLFFMVKLQSDSIWPHTLTRFPCQLAHLHLHLHLCWMESQWVPSPTSPICKAFGSVICISHWRRGSRPVCLIQLL